MLAAAPYADLAAQLAKALQLLANKPSFLKVPHMSVLKSLFEGSQARVQSFLLRLCEVADMPPTEEVRAGRRVMHARASPQYGPRT